MFQHLSFLQRGQQVAFVFLFIVVIIRFFVYTQKTIELDHLSGSGKFIVTVADTDGCRCLFQFGVCHL